MGPAFDTPMDTARDTAVGAVLATSLAGTARPPTQYTRLTVLAIWAAAAVPMGLLAWVVAPRLARGESLAEPLIACFLAGLIWQFLLVVALVGYEQRSLRWRLLREALWLTAPKTARRRGGRLWWWTLAVLAGVGAVQMSGVNPAAPANRDMGTLLASTAGHQLLRGNWGELAVIVALCLFNTVLGEELLFRGVLLPRMQGAFGRVDWIANGVLFGLYHLHQPWSMPGSILEGLVTAFGSRRLRSAWLGIIAHSVQSVLVITMTTAIVLS